VLARIAAAVFALSIAATLAIGALGPASWQSAVASDGPACPFKRITGLPCPFCGMTRATLAMGGGHWHRAFELHPFAPIVLAGIVVMLGLIIAGKTSSLLSGHRPQLILGAILTVWILRLILG